MQMQINDYQNIIIARQNEMVQLQFIIDLFLIDSIQQFLIMTVFSQFKELLFLIKKKSNISISNETCQHLSKNLLSHCKSFEDDKFDYKSFGKLVISCWKLNVPLFCIIFVFTIVSSILSIIAVNLNDYIIQYSTKSDNQQQTTRQSFQIFKILIILFTFKLFENLVDQIGSYMTMNSSFRVYSSLYYNFIKRKSLLTGKVLNIIEDDLQKMQYFSYYLVNICIIPFLIIVFSTMLILSLNSNIQQILVAFLLILLVFLYLMLARVIFQVNQKFMNKKDSRLQMCIDRQLVQKMFQQRKVQVYQIRKFMWVQTFIKWLTQTIFFLLYILIFLINFKDDDINTKTDKYYQLMLLGMIKTPMQTMCFIFYSFSSMINSLKRICLNVNVHSPDQQRQSLKTQVRQARQKNSGIDQNLNQSLIQSSSLNSFEKQQQQVQNKFKSNQNKNHLNNNDSQTQLAFNTVSKQRGQIKIKNLLNYINKNTSFVLKFFIFVLIVLFFFVKFQRIQITSQIIASRMTFTNWIVFSLPLIVPFMLVLFLINFFFMISLKLFKSFKSFTKSVQNKNIHTRKLDGEQLNRISGDIQAVDKGISLYLYDLISISFTILASLLYSILKIQSLLNQIIISVLIVATIVCAIKSNRYFMKSRRQVKRDECCSKSNLIELLKQNKSIESCKQMKQNWKKIYMYKNIGIMIQNSYIFILYMQVLIIQLIFVGICLQGDLLTSTEQPDVSEGQFQARKIMITIVLQLDYELFSLFISSIHMQIGLVSFQRCVNMSIMYDPLIKQKQNYQQQYQKIQDDSQRQPQKLNEENNNNQI